MGKLATLMIEQGSKGVFDIPKALAEDVDINLINELRFNSRSVAKDSGFCSLSGSMKNIDDLIEKPEICTSVQFARRCSPKRLNSNNLNNTVYAVAELFAVVKALPDSDSRKKRFLSNIIDSNRKNVTKVPHETDSRRKVIHLRTFTDNKRTPIRRPNVEEHASSTDVKVCGGVDRFGDHIQMAETSSAASICSDVSADVRFCCSPFASPLKCRRPLRKPVRDQRYCQSKLQTNLRVKRNYRETTKDAHDRILRRRRTMRHAIV